MFKFSFLKAGEESDSHPEGGPSETENPELEWSPSKKIDVSPSHLSYMLSQKGSLLHTNVGSLYLSHLSSDSVVKSVVEKCESDCSVKLAEDLHSDLVPAKYEGGLKVWECTQDLLEWLFSAKLDEDLDGKSVLDLGCGAGLLGIAALTRGANVIFQDYNEEVLDSYTVPNVLLNLTDQKSHDLIGSQCEFYSGDWSSFTEKYQEGREKELKFDFILTSETIYNPGNYHKLHNVFKKCLKPTGCVFLAAKTYYFGVGGSLRQFECLLQEDGILKSEVCWKCSSGVSREIIKITFAPVSPSS